MAVGARALAVAQGLLVVLGVLAAGPADAARVVVFSLDPRGVEAEAAEQGTATLLRTLSAIEGTRAIDAKRAKARLGVDVDEQARICAYDVFCLVELGELLQARFVLAGHLSRPPPTAEDADEGLQFELVLIDVAKAAVTEILRWRVPDLDPDAVTEASAAAARRLFGPRDVEVKFELTPPEARLRFYGEPVEVPEDEATLRYWSGVYHATLTADGYHPLRVRVRLDRGARTVEVPLSLEQDPLWTGPTRRKKDAFDRHGRRTGPSADDRTAGALTTPEAPSRAYASPVPWLVAGAGLGLGALGTALMVTAQSDYDALSGQTRFSAGTTVTAEVARQERDALRTRARAGSGVLVGGAAVLAGALLWMMLDAALAPPPPRPLVQAPARRAPSPAARAAARGLAQELTP